MRRLALLALVLVVLLATACGGDASEATPGDGAPAQPGGDATTGADAPVASDGTTSPAPTTTAGSGDSSPATTAAAAPLPGLPPWTAGYRSWTKLNAKPLPERDPDPHRGTKNVFASKPAENGVYPAGTVIVKEAFRPGADFVGLVAAMRKQPGRNPEHADWVFVEWTRESRGAPFAELARDDVCTSCHVGARERDYVFTAG